MFVYPKPVSFNIFDNGIFIDHMHYFRRRLIIDTTNMSFI